MVEKGSVVFVRNMAELKEYQGDLEIAYVYGGGHAGEVYSDLEMTGEWIKQPDPAVFLSLVRCPRVVIGNVEELRG